MLDHIIEISNSANFEVWESLLNPLFDIVEEYEEVLETKVKELKKEGKKISEIASLLKIPPIDVYEYIKKLKGINDAFFNKRLLLIQLTGARDKFCYKRFFSVKIQEIYKSKFQLYNGG